MLDAGAHIRFRQFGKHGVINIFHRAVDYTLRVDKDGDAVGRDAEEVRRLDDLEAFVHQRGTVHRDFRPHVPRRVAERVLDAHGGELLTGITVKRSARGGQEQALHFPVPPAREALENGAVFAVDRQKLRPALLRAAHDDFPGDDKRLLVGKGKAPPGIEDGEGREQTRLTENGVDERRGAALADCRGNGIGARKHPYRRIREPCFQFPRGGRIRHDDRAGQKSARLRLHGRDVAVRREQIHGKALTGGDLKSLPPDGTGGAEYGNHRGLPRCGAAHESRANVSPRRERFERIRRTGEMARTLSKRSRTPP